MSRYRVLLHGRNLRLDLDGEQQIGGFYISCCVEAPTNVMAPTAAIEMLRRHPRYLALLDGSSGNPAQPEPIILADEVERLPSWDRRSLGVVLGFVFYADPDEASVQ